MVASVTNPVGLRITAAFNRPLATLVVADSPIR